MQNKPWKLVIGCHKGTFTSRDCHETTTKFDSDEPLTSLDDCVECAKKWRSNYSVIGVFIWYAKAISPDGKIYNDIIHGASYV